MESFREGIFLKQFDPPHQGFTFCYSLRVLTLLQQSLTQRITSMLSTFLHRPFDGVTIWQVAVTPQLLLFDHLQQQGTQFLINATASPLFLTTTLPLLKEHIRDDILPLIPFILPHISVIPPQPLNSYPWLPDEAKNVDELPLNPTDLTAINTLEVLIHSTPDTPLWRRFLQFNMIEAFSTASATTLDRSSAVQVPPPARQTKEVTLYGPLLLIIQRGSLPWDKVKVLASLIKSLKLETSLGYDITNPNSEKYVYSKLKYGFYQRVDTFQNVWVIDAWGKGLLALFQKFGFVPHILGRAPEQVAKVLIEASKGADSYL